MSFGSRKKIFATKIIKMHYRSICIYMTICVFVLSSAKIYKLEMPNGLQSYFNGAKMKHNISDIPGEQIFWECMQRVMWQMSEQMGHNVTSETRDYLDRLLQVAVDGLYTQLPRHRKEYRMLTDEERERFHNAIIALKEDTALKPNVYSAFSELHAGDVIPMAHFGPGFPGWHRVFLLIFETALRMKDASVSIPYWASNLDNEMEDPTKSIIWSESFLGNGDGFVNSGPFADFKVHSHDSILYRNIGGSGSLMTNEGIHGVLSQNYTADITNPRAPQAHNLELQHNTVHVWMGGNMDDLSTSAEDPIFYMHHSFIDFLWEEFRTHQKILGIEPETDYPLSNWGSKRHEPNENLGFGDLRNIDALSSVFSDLVKYDPSPVCTKSHPICGSKYLRCDTSHRPPICISLSREEMNKTKPAEEQICVDAHLTRPIQNSFAINQYCDIRKWAYIPVKIVLQRPPEFTNYKAFPVLNNRPVTNSDVFSTIHVNKTIGKTLATNPNCKKTNAVARKIFIESHGLNYYGKYKDFTVLDQRQALSSATTYLGVKSPESNYTDVLVYAYDYCGRSCRPFCINTSTNPPSFQACSGVVRITPESPKMYGINYADAVNNVWHAANSDDLPQIEEHHACVTFYCDYSGVWPWDRSKQIEKSKLKKTKRQITQNNLKEKKQSDKPRKKKQTAKPRKKNINTSNTDSITNFSLKKSTKNPKKNLHNTSKQLDNHSNMPKVTIIKTSVSRRTLPQSQPNVRVIDLSPVTNPPPILHRRVVSNIETNFYPGERQRFYPDRRSERRRPMFDHQRFLPKMREPQSRQSFQRYHRRDSDHCRLNPGCILQVPCSPCSHKHRESCGGPSRMVAICINGIYMLEPMFFNFKG